jgi:hypothetical protein
MIYEFNNPMPVVTPLGDGYAIYMRDGGSFENDIWTIVLEEGGKILHFRTDQIKIFKNATFDIKNSSI